MSNMAIATSAGVAPERVAEKARELEQAQHIPRILRGLRASQDERDVFFADVIQARLAAPTAYRSNENYKTALKNFKRSCLRVINKNCREDCYTLGQLYTTLDLWNPEVLLKNLAPERFP